MFFVSIYEHLKDKANLYCYRNLSKPIWLSLGLLSWSKYCWGCSRGRLEGIYHKGLSPSLDYLYCSKFTCYSQMPACAGSTIMDGSTMTRSKRLYQEIMPVAPMHIDLPWLHSLFPQWTTQSLTKVCQLLVPRWPPFKEVL